MLGLKLAEHSKHLAAGILSLAAQGLRWIMLGGLPAYCIRVVTKCRWVWMVSTPSVVSTRSMSRPCNMTPHPIAMGCISLIAASGMLVTTFFCDPHAWQQTGAIAYSICC